MKKKSTIILIVALVLVALGSLMAWGTQTDGGNVRIVDVQFMGSNGVEMNGLLYIPSTATSETPAPGVLAIHGYINSNETQDGFAIEFARRGFVVLAIDQPGHGYSDPPAFANGFGGIDGLLYLRSLDFVDPANIGLEGHSMGGWASVVAAGVLPDMYTSMVLEGSSTGTFGGGDGTATWPRNLALVFSQYDEFSLLMWGSPTGAGIVDTAKLQTLFNTTETVRVGEVYGSIEDGTARVLYQPAITHPMDHISTEAIGYAVDWFNRTLTGGNGLDASNQIWYWKEIGTLLALIGLILSFFPMGSLLLGSAFFKPLEEPMPELKPLKGWGWWVGALITIAIPALTFFKFNNMLGLTWNANAWFSQNITTGILFWAIGNAVISLILFLLWHFISNRKEGATGDNYGLTWAKKLAWGKIGKSFLLALCIAGFAYLLLAVAHYFFNIDFRFWIVALKPLSPLQFRIFLCYLVPFAIYFLVVATVLHGEMVKLGKDGKPLAGWKSMLIDMALMITGIVILLLVQYIPLFAGGTLGGSEAPESLLDIVAIQFVPILAIVGLVSNYFYRKTGHIYVGAFLNAIFVTWYIVAGQAIHFAF
ncbi:MAG TPA: alpha/beta fold hydrolase [Longilinea sp.]|nr:alpha/beta fold hydrolase [Longilinea sp.]